MGQKLQDGKKVLCVSQNAPYSESHPGQTAGLSNLPFWIIGKLYKLNIHNNFHASGTILNVPKVYTVRFKIDFRSQIVIRTTCSKMAGGEGSSSSKLNTADFVRGLYRLHFHHLPKVVTCFSPPRRCPLL